MAILITILTLVLVVVVIFVISAPLRAAWAATPTKPVGEDDRGGSGRDRPGEGDAKSGEIELVQERIQLEAAREAKYREIRDTELDYRTGKLSQEDFAATDGALRAEALEILNRLAALDKREPD